MSSLFDLNVFTYFWIRTVPRCLSFPIILIKWKIPCYCLECCSLSRFQKSAERWRKFLSSSRFSMLPRVEQKVTRDNSRCIKKHGEEKQLQISFTSSLENVLKVWKNWSEPERNLIFFNFLTDFDFFFSILKKISILNPDVEKKNRTFRSEHCLCWIALQFGWRLDSRRVQVFLYCIEKRVPSFVYWYKRSSSPGMGLIVLVLKSRWPPSIEM